MAALMGTLGACSTEGGGSDGRLTVAAAFYPIEEIVRRVGGDAIDVVTLVPPGEEAHEYDPTPKQLEQLAEADVVFYLGQGFQPNVEKALESLPSSVQRVDLLDELTLLPITSQLPGTDGEAEGETLADGNDPHVWLAPANMRQMSASVLATLNGVAPDDATTFATNQGSYGTDLDELDTEFADGLRECRSRMLVSSHRAFGYLADAYDLTAVAIAGVSPSEEPSAKTLEAIAEFTRTNDVTTIFFEENLPSDLATTLADEVGATTDVLDTVESLSDEQLQAGDDYGSLMRANLVALRTGLGCT
ncbi:MAG: zinc ABC transporter substrate-binding protein, partial [Actinobacteria bacterium]|nr:zinc ABC transporter substrate-binding protein [Actinomycetota bacterium]